MARELEGVGSAASQGVRWLPYKSGESVNFQGTGSAACSRFPGWRPTRTLRVLLPIIWPDSPLPTRLCAIAGAARVLVPGPGQHQLHWAARVPSPLLPAQACHLPQVRAAATPPSAQACHLPQVRADVTLLRCGPPPGARAKEQKPGAVCGVGIMVCEV